MTKAMSYQLSEKVVEAWQNLDLEETDLLSLAAKKGWIHLNKQLFMETIGLLIHEGICINPSESFQQITACSDKFTNEDIKMQS